MDLNTEQHISQESSRCIYCRKVLTESATDYELQHQVHITCKFEIEVFHETTFPNEVYKEWQEFFKEFNINQYKHFTNPELYKLRRLNLNDKNITYLPKSIHYFRNLKELALGGNNLTALPEELGQMDQLEMINLSSNNFHGEIPSIVEKLTSIKRFMCAGNNLETFPEVLEKFHDLEILDVSYNNLESISDYIGENRSFRGLYAHYNHIKALPNTLSQLPNLIILQLANNALSEIPIWIEQKRYQLLNLTNNPIDNITYKLYRLKSLLLNGVVLQQ